MYALLDRVVEADGPGFGWIHNPVDGRVSNRVADGDAIAVQCQIPAVERRPGSVPHITENRITARGKLKSDLVGSSGFQADVDQREPVTLLDSGIVQFGTACSGGMLPNQERCSILLGDVVDPGSRRGRSSFDKGEIPLVHLMLSELAR